jgi:predicted transcriptional regulator
MRKKAPAREIPPPLELECLRVLWHLGSGSVHEVRAELDRKRPLAYTTVMTLLERLERKGAAVRHKNGRAFVYAPGVDRETLRREAVRELVEQYFDGEVGELRNWLRPGAAAQEASTAGASRDSGAADLDTALL